MGQREGVGSVPRGVGKAWLRRQGPKQVSVSSGAQQSRRQSPGLSLPHPKIRIYPAPASASDTGGTSSSEKNKDLFCGSTFTSEFFPPGPPEHLLLGKGGSREQLNTLAGGAGEKGGAGLWEEQGSSKSWLQQTMSPFNLNLTASHIRKAVGKQERRGD